MKKVITLFFALTIVLQIQVAAAYQYQGPEAELINLINSERTQNGVPPLAINWEVSRLARYKSEEMKQHSLFSHDSLVYGSPSQTLERFRVPYSVVGANIAMGQETAMEVLEAWLSSPSHRANLINAEFESAGTGLSWDDNGIAYWTLIMIGE